MMIINRFMTIHTLVSAALVCEALASGRIDTFAAGAAVVAFALSAFRIEKAIPLIPAAQRMKIGLIIAFIRLSHIESAGNIASAAAGAAPGCAQKFTGILHAKISSGRHIAAVIEISPVSP